LNSKPHEAQLEDQKPTESSRRSSRRRKTAKANKRHEKRQNHEKSKKSSKPKQKLKINTPPEINIPLTLSMQAPPIDRHYHISSLNHPISKKFNQLYAHTLPLWQ
jgi:hypothetical protein